MFAQALLAWRRQRLVLLAFRRHGKTLHHHQFWLHNYDNKARVNLTLRIAVFQFKSCQEYVGLIRMKEVNMGNSAVESVGKAFLLPLDCLLG